MFQMKIRILVLLALILFSQVAYAYPFKEALNFSQVFWGWCDSLGRSVPVAINATSGAVLTEGTSTFSTATDTPLFTDEYGPITASTTTILLATNGSQAVTILANCRQIMLTSTGTFQFSVGTTTVDPNLPGVYNVTFPCTKEIPVGIANVATGTRIGIRQWGR